MKSFNQFGISASKRVYEQEVTYDAFSHVKVRDTIYWDIDTNDFSASYTNGRKTGVNAPDYDAAGNIVYTETGHTGKQWTTIDAAGRRTAVRDRWRVATAAHEENETGYVFDGDGRPVIEKEGMRSIIGLNPDPMVVHTEGYQVWSTVLGASLTTVNTVGNKRHTKVFAGGAHIATQDANGTTSTGDDRILFTTADPVTGTKATFDYTDGVSFFAREDTEPLGGQQIERNDPGTGYPTDYGQVLGTPRDPEWQCVAATMRFGEDGFRDMPVHCQKARSESKDFSIVEAFGFRVREASPAAVTKLTDSPIKEFSLPGDLTGTNTFAARAMSAATTSTEKLNVDQDGGCDWDKDGRPECSVQSLPSTDPTDAISAEHGSSSSPLVSEEETVFQTDPCEGKKGALDYSRVNNQGENAAQHILNRHIRPNKSPYASRYVFPPDMRNGDLEKEMTSMGEAVAALNQITFVNAVGVHDKARKAVVYSYAFPSMTIKTPLGSIRLDVPVGIDNDKNSPNRGQTTNVNTVIITEDCKQVITSHPGTAQNGLVTGIPQWFRNKAPFIYGR